MCSVLEYLSLDDSSQEKWTFYYFILSWGAELGNGMIQTITGPMQPFLAYNLGTDTSTINLVWTLGFIGFLIGSILTSSIFTKHLHTGKRKLILMFVILFLTGLATLAIPFADNLPFLLFVRFLQFLGYGIFLTGDSILIVFTLGPKKSRPFINALHFFISIGFLLGTFIVQPFIPEVREKVCRTNSGDLTNITSIEDSKQLMGLPDDLNSINDSVDVIKISDANLPVIDTVMGLQSIAWPFIISAGWCMFVSFGFLFLAHSGLQMPQYYDENTNTKHKPESRHELKGNKRILFLGLIILFFALSGAVIRVFQSMSTTFALCGPLELDAHRAALTDSFYSCGMCLGRLASIALATRFLPSTLLCGSTVFCLTASILLLALAPHFYISLYLGEAVMGFFVSWQFGTGFSWTSHHMNITGFLSSIFFIGLGIGSLSSPPLAGYLFTINPMSVLYLVAAMVFVQAVTVLLLRIVSREENKRTYLTSHLTSQLTSQLDQKLENLQ